MFPAARFVYLFRDPRPVLASMLEAWQSGRFRTYPNLPGWTGLPWSLLLVPGWRGLVGLPFPRVVATQWSTTTRILLDDLERLPATSWAVAHCDALVSRPDAEIRRLCRVCGLDWDLTLPSALPLSRYTVTAPDPAKWQRCAAEIGAAWPVIAEQADRAAQLATRAARS